MRLFILALWEVSVLAATLLVGRRLKTPKVDGSASSDALEKKSRRAKECSVGVLLLIVTAVFSQVAYATATSPAALVELGACWVALLVAAAIDAKLRVIPHAVPLALVVVRIACFSYEYFNDERALGFALSSLVGCAACFLVLFIASKASHGGIGMGDVWLVSAVGFTVGVHFALYTLAFAVALCALVAAVLLLLKKRGKNDSLPFAPFLCGGYGAALLVSLL